MAGAMRKMGVYLGLVEDDDRDEYAYSEEGYENYDDICRAPAIGTTLSVDLCSSLVFGG